MCGLTWNDIDFNKNCIYVRRIIERIKQDDGKSKAVILEPKTQKSKRKIPMSKELSEKLKYMSKFYEKEAYVITGKIDKYTEPTIYEELYKRKLDKLNIEYKKFHCLRHTFATKCVELGMPVKDLSIILGHSSVTTTLNIYVHPTLKDSVKYLNKL